MHFIDSFNMIAMYKLFVNLILRINIYWLFIALLSVICRIPILIDIKIVLLD